MDLVEYFAGKYQVIVVGAGHAGCEAALAAARMGCETLLITLNIDTIAHMPCNPSLGGPAKGHLVREIDALGGQMAVTGDETSIQARMLNLGKGPAVQALRIQSDKNAYRKQMLKTILAQPGLTLLQALVEKLVTREGKICGVVTRTGARFESESLVLTSGTYLRGKIIIGAAKYAGGPNGQLAAVTLSEELKEMGIELGRFKTGTPPRIHKRNVDFKKFMIHLEKDRGKIFVPAHKSRFWRIMSKAKSLAGWGTPLGHTEIISRIFMGPPCTWRLRERSPILSSSG